MLKERMQSIGKKAYVYLADDKTGERFLEQAEREGFRFGDGALPTSRQFEEIMAIYPEGYICYVGTYGRIAYQCSSVNKLDYFG